MGLFSGDTSSTATLAWDNFKCGIDSYPYGSLDGTEDYVYANHDFNDPGGAVTWQTITLTHDNNGNLTDDGLFKYKYDGWNP